MVYMVSLMIQLRSGIKISDKGTSRTIFNGAADADVQARDDRCRQQFAHPNVKVKKTCTIDGTDSVEDGTKVNTTPQEGRSSRLKRWAYPEASEQRILKPREILSLPQKLGTKARRAFPNSMLRHPTMARAHVVALV